jgi:hypothetical protein
LHVWLAVAGQLSVRLDRRKTAHCTARLGLICLDRRLVGARGPAAHGPDCNRPSATALNNAPSRQLVGSWTRMQSIIPAALPFRPCLTAVNTDFDEPIELMMLGNMRQLGVLSLAV